MAVVQGITAGSLPHHSDHAPLEGDRRAGGRALGPPNHCGLILASVEPRHGSGVSEHSAARRLRENGGTGGPVAGTARNCDRDVQQTAPRLLLSPTRG